ncbi:hypothetical protein GGS23DRAFT_576471 [Durotheca rogersii]|uniref:uncharacterized protein n=1 Tax=Durotheca rogersii TaxID=419775 RepID=UPI0022202F86|nr:uncharacterized protein GGS23DRAFT_576471 [Durotheca rogersii]KAI5861358.1 hypothetical protein GGS23DRAFT_576471 [Durotheca rogersii]
MIQKRGVGRETLRLLSICLSATAATAAATTCCCPCATLHDAPAASNTVYIAYTYIIKTIASVAWCVVVVPGVGSEKKESCSATLSLSLSGPGPGTVT